MEEPLDLAHLATLGDADFARTIEALAPGHAPELARTIAERPSSTVEPRGFVSDALGRQAIKDLGGAEGPGGLVSGLELDRTIGEGGMGVVRLATQRALGRPVAVKTLRAGGRTEQATLRLLREAWITGALEHPNIVPVHDLGLDETGAPVIVMKRIEGETWESLLGDPTRVAAQEGVVDLLEHHLRIFVQVCRAVSLAHARGILHRDIKPENVMIGRFGEVYLVDWGIAVSLRDDPSGRLPTLAASADMAGTPCYMAPEMLGGGHLDERTDVYLLGSVLHEILTGRAPHEGATFREIVMSIVASQPRLGDEVPRELADVTRRAMRRAKEERFASVDELRARVEWYLAHRGSIALEAAARLRLEALRGLAETEGRERFYRAFSEARFGFQQAVAASADNEAARAGLHEVLVLAVEFELARGTAEGAEAALRELDTPPAALKERVAVALRAREAERARVAELEAVGRALDTTAGVRTRIFVFGILGAAWIVFPFAGPRFEAAHPNISPSDGYLVTLALFGMTAPLVYWARDTLFKTMMNRRVVAAFLVVCALQIGLEVGVQRLGLNGQAWLVLHLYGWFAAGAAASVFVEPRLLPSAVVYLLAFILASSSPSHKWTFAALANVVLYLNVAVAWAPQVARVGLRPPGWKR